MVAKLDSQDWRDQYDKLRSKFQKLYQDRMPKLKEYETMVNSSLSDLLGETVPAAKSYFDQANGLGEFVTNEYTPALNEYMQSARDYDTPERRAEATGRAMADVQEAGNAARTSALARLESYGIDPSVTRSASLDANARLQTALESVKQGRDAATGVEERGRMYMSDALDKGATGAGLGISLGRTGTDMLSNNVNATSGVMRNIADIYGTPTENLNNQRDLIKGSLDAKIQEVQSKQAASDGGAWGKIAGTVGTIAGIGLGSFAGAGGAALGGQIGGAIGNAAGGNATAGGSQNARWTNEYY